MSATRCGICDRETGPSPRGLARLGVAVCKRCFGRPVTVRTATSETLPSVRTFYVTSISGRGEAYIVKRLGRTRITCTCPDFTHRGQVLGVPCKHIRIVRLLARAAGGWSKLPGGITIPFRLSDRRVTPCQ